MDNCTDDLIEITKLMNLFNAAAQKQMNSLALQKSCYVLFRNLQTSTVMEFGVKLNKLGNMAIH